MDKLPPVVLEIRCDCQQPRVPFNFRTNIPIKKRECNFCRRLFIVKLYPLAKDQPRVEVFHINNFEFVEQQTPREWYAVLPEGE